MTFKSRKIFVTGGTGFVGTHTVRALVQSGWQVRCLIREHSDVSRLPPGVEAVEGDLSSPASLVRCLDGCQAVVHIAGIIRAGGLDEFMKVNRDATSILVKASRSAGIERFLLCSSQAAGGPELDGRPRRVEDPSEPVTYYGRSKLAGEQVVRNEADGMWWTIIRPPAVYGPFDRAFLTFVRWVKWGFKLRLGDGRLRFAIIHGEDLGQAMRVAIEADIPSGQTFYVTDGSEWTLFDMGRIVESSLGKKAVWIPIPLSLAPGIAAGVEFFAGLQGKMALLSRQKILELSQPAWTCDSLPFQQVTGFQPRYTLESGMKQTIDWYREHKWI